MTIKEKQRRKRLVLRRGAHLFLRSQKRQEGVDFRFAYIGGMADVVKVDVAPDTMSIDLLRTRAVMARAQAFPHLINQLGRWAQPICLSTRDERNSFELTEDSGWVA